MLVDAVGIDLVGMGVDNCRMDTLMWVGEVKVERVALNNWGRTEIT